MFKSILTGSFWYRRTLYTPMIIVVVIALCLIGAADLVNKTFNQVISDAMNRYGANVILKTGSNRELPEKSVSVALESKTFGEITQQLATVNVKELLEQNPAWVIRGNGDLIVGQSAAEKMQLKEGDTLRYGGDKYRIALMKSGTRFDNYILKDGPVKNPDLILIRSDNPAQYAGPNATVLNEMIHTKYAVLESVHRLTFIIAIITAIAAILTVINLAHVDASSRRREFGLLKSLGGSFMNIVQFVGLEYLVLTVVTIAIGIPAAYGLGWSIVATTSDAPLHFSVTSIIYISATSLIAFSGAALRYLMETKQKIITDELQGR